MPDADADPTTTDDVVDYLSLNGMDSVEDSERHEHSRDSCGGRLAEKDAGGGNEGITAHTITGYTNEGGNVGSGQIRGEWDGQESRPQRRRVGVAGSLRWWR